MLKAAGISWVLLMLLASCTSRTRTLVEQLESPDTDEVLKATVELKKDPESAIAELERAASQGRSEQSSRVRHLLKVLRVIQQLSPTFLEKFPGVEERLAEDSGGAWVEAVLRADDPFSRRRMPRLTGADFAPLLPQAIAQATEFSDLDRLLMIAEDFGIRSVAPRLLLNLGEGKSRDRKIESLGRLDAREATTDLLGLLKKDPTASQRCAESLSKLRAYEELRAVFRDGTIPIETRLQVAKTLAFASFIGETDERGLIPMVMNQVRSVRSDKLSPTAWLNVLWQLRANAELRILLGEMPDEDSKVAVVRTINDACVLEAIPDLVPLLKATSPALRSAAAQTLGYMAARDHVAELAILLEDPEPWVRAEAARALSRLEDPRGTPALLRLLQDSEPSIQQWCIITLADLRAGEAIPAVSRLLDSTDERICSEAARALEALSARVAVPALEKRLLTVRGRPGITFADALLSLGAAEKADVFVRGLLRNGTPVERVFAIKTFTEFPPPDIHSILVDFLGDGDPSVRARAANALVVFGDSSDIEHLSPLLGDADSRVRRYVACALCSLGSPEGVDNILVDHLDLFYLNALRQPEVWKRLRDTKPPENAKLSTRKTIEVIARAVGLTVDWPSDLEEGPVLGRPRWISTSSTNLALLRTQAMSRLHVILERDKIRVLPWKEERKFWKEWRASLKQL